MDKIIAIQARHRGLTNVWKEWEIGEEGCLDSLFTLLDGIDWKRASIVGYNVLKFDFPFIDERLRALGLMNEKAWHTLHDWPHVIDLYQFLGDDYLRATAWYASLTPIQNGVSGRDVPELYAKKDFGIIQRYVEREIEAMEFLYESLKKEDFYEKLVKLRSVVARLP